MALAVKNSFAKAGDVRCEFDSWVEKIPWRSLWQPTPVFLPGESPWTEEPGGLESTEFLSELEVQCEKKREAKMSSRLFFLSSCHWRNGHLLRTMDSGKKPV